MKEDEILEGCLVYKVLQDMETWIGYPSMRNLATFLFGVQRRVIETGVEFPEWKISGPLHESEFYESIVQKAGHPTLNIGWQSALDLVNFKSSDSALELVDLIESWHKKHNLQSISVSWPMNSQPPQGIYKHLSHLAARPGMYLGGNDGWALYCYLSGMRDGGNWLGLPSVDDIDKIYERITNRSIESYGSKWAAFRCYEAKWLLSWADIDPMRLAEQVD